MRPHAAVAVLALFAVSGCMSISAKRILNADPRGKDCHIDVYSKREDVGRPFEVLCIVEVRTGSTIFDDRTGANALNQAIKVACGCGAYAVIVESMGSQGVSSGGWGYGFAHVEAIRYKEESSVPRANDTPGAGSGQVTKTQKVTERLETLRDLYDRKLISKKIYESETEKAVAELNE